MLRKFNKTAYLIKRKSKIGYSLNLIWDRLDWEPTVITTTLCSSTNGARLKDTQREKAL